LKYGGIQHVSAGGPKGSVLDVERQGFKT